MTAVLVTYASKHHATEEIAITIGRQLKEHGLKVEIRTADFVNTLEPFDAVVLGSAVYAGRWMKEAQTFLKENIDELTQRPVWVFSSGPTGEGDPVELVKGALYPVALEPVIAQIKPRDITVFHGKLDTNELGFGERLIVNMVKAPTGDFRDWDAIRAWADGIAAALTGEQIAE